jgi:hypothetical protein
MMIPARTKKHHPSYVAIRRAMRLDIHDSDRGAGQELARLRSLGLVEFRSKKMVWIMRPEHAVAMTDVIEGRAFHDARPRESPLPGARR